MEKESGVKGGSGSFIMNDDEGSTSTRCGLNLYRGE